MATAGRDAESIMKKLVREQNYLVMMRPADPQPENPAVAAEVLRVDRFADPNTDRNRPDDRTTAAHRLVRTKNCKRYYRRSATYRHDEAPLLEWKQPARATPRALWKDEK